MSTERRTKSKSKIINKVSPNDKHDWSWKPEDKDLPKVKLAKSKKNKNRGKRKEKRKRISKLDNNNFYSSKEWRQLRARVLEKYECKCMMCGRSPKIHGVVLHVDHIKPRSKYPELSLDINNLQVLCEDDNSGKSNKYDTDWRPDEQAISDELDLMLLAKVGATWN